MTFTINQVGVVSRFSSSVGLAENQFAGVGSYFVISFWFSRFLIAVLSTMKALLVPLHIQRKYSNLLMCSRYTMVESELPSEFRWKLGTETQ